MKNRLPKISLQVPAAATLRAVHADRGSLGAFYLEGGETTIARRQRNRAGKVRYHQVGPNHVLFNFGGRTIMAKETIALQEVFNQQKKGGIDFI